MARRTRITGKAIKARGRERQKKGTLANLAVLPSTLNKYRQAMWAFSNHLDSFDLDIPGTNWALDDAVCAYVEDLWADGEHLGHAEIILAAFHHFALQLIGRLPGAWRRVGAWRRNELPHRAPPMPPAVVRGLAGLAVIQGRADVALALLISFHGMLRGAEVCALRLGDIMHCGDSAVLNLGLTKIGVRKGVSEQVTITDATLARWLQKIAAKRNCQSKLLNLSSSSYRLYFK